MRLLPEIQVHWLGIVVCAAVGREAGMIVRRRIHKHTRRIRCDFTSTEEPQRLGFDFA